MILRALLFALAMTLWLPRVFAAEPASFPTGVQRDVVFDHYSPYSRNAELMRRMLTPLSVQRLQAASANKDLRTQSIVLENERFAVYVPAAMPTKGYAVLVYVSPWDEAAVPKDWIADFDQRGMIFVVAANAGNDVKILDRREPLALLAAQNILQRYRVDPDRLYIGGLSGGSRVALRIALGYPDLFRGVLLNAGSDPIGDATRPIPPVELLHTFQESMRVVYLTNKGDSLHVTWDLASKHSLQEWCVFDVHTESATWGGHVVPDPITLNHALNTLDARDTIDPAKLAACRASVHKDLDAQLGKVEELVTSRRLDDAQKRLFEVDAHFGGLAAPRSTDLQTKIDALRGN